MLHPSEVVARGGWEYCPNSGGLSIQRFDDLGRAVGRPKGLSCRRNTCPYCLVTNIWRVSLGMAHSRPSRYAVLTGVPSSDWGVNRLALKLLWQGLQRGEVRAGRRELLLRAWYCFEVNPQGTGYHLNLWWWGPDVPQARLSELSSSVGWGSVVHVQRYQSKAAVKYGMKEAANYGLKELARGPGSRVNDLTEAQWAYLARNGGHLMGARRGRAAPWRDGTTDSGFSGRAVKGLDGALRAYWESKGPLAASSVVLDRTGLPAFSKDIGPAHSEVGSLPVGSWRRAAPGRSDWAWGSWEDETPSLLEA